MIYQYDDGGRKAAGFKGDTGDCVTRAVVIATELDYRQVYDALAGGNTGERDTKRRRGPKGRTARDGIHTTRKWFKDYMHSLGWTWTPTMGIGTGCTVHLADGELPMGRLIVAVSKHYTAVIDGVIHDTHDPSANRDELLYPLNTPADKRPKNAILLGNGNGWLYAPKRCVYGYWQEAATA